MTHAFRTCRKYAMLGQAVEDEKDKDASVQPDDSWHLVRRDDPRSLQKHDPCGSRTVATGDEADDSVPYPACLQRCEEMNQRGVTWKGADTMLLDFTTVGSNRYESTWSSWWEIHPSCATSKLFSGRKDGGSSPKCGDVRRDAVGHQVRERPHLRLQPLAAQLSVDAVREPYWWITLRYALQVAGASRLRRSVRGLQGDVFSNVRTDAVLHDQAHEATQVGPLRQAHPQVLGHRPVEARGRISGTLRVADRPVIHVSDAGTVLMDEASGEYVQRQQGGWVGLGSSKLSSSVALWRRRGTDRRRLQPGGHPCSRRSTLTTTTWRR